VQALLCGSETGNAIGCMLFRHKPFSQDVGHIHDLWSKFAFIVDGSYQFFVDGEVIKASSGSLVLIPRGALHGFKTRSGGEVLFVSWPSGNEEFFLEIGELGPQATAGDVARIWAEFGTRRKAS
jgi:quercetin dioxygenase-like cupin family protein